MTGPIVTILVAVIIFFLLIILGSKISDEKKIVGLMLCFILVIAGIIWYRKVKEEKRNLYYDNMWCLSRIVAMTVAIEKYNIKNIDTKKMIENLEEDTIKKLIEEKYLSSDFIEISKNDGCEYKSQGDISTSLGEIYCKKHGNKKELTKKVNDLVKYKK